MPPDPEQCENQCLPHWRFWLGLLGMAAGIIVSYTRISYDVEILRLWRVELEKREFSRLDWEREKALLQKEIQAERSFARTLCNEVRRLAVELRRVPTNDCDRP